MFRLCALIVFASVLVGCGPKDYDECILSSMKGVTGDIAARAVKASCHAKFIEIKGDSEELPPEALSLIDGKGGFMAGYFAGSLYNGNKEWVVSQVTIRIEASGAQSGASSGPKDYNAEVEIKPLTASSFSIGNALPVAGGHRWHLVGARGYAVK